MNEIEPKRGAEAAALTRCSFSDCAAEIVERPGRRGRPPLYCPDHSVVARRHGGPAVLGAARERITTGESVNGIAARYGVSGRMVTRAARLLREATPDLIAQIEAGETTITGAEDLLCPPNPSTLPLPSRHAAERRNTVREMTVAGSSRTAIARDTGLSTARIQYLQRDMGLKAPEASAAKGAGSLKALEIAERLLGSLELSEVVMQVVLDSLDEIDPGALECLRERLDGVAKQFRTIQRAFNEQRRHNNASTPQ